MTLRELGISELQEIAYRALLADSSRDVAALAALAGADEPAICASLDDLAAMSVLRPSPDAPARFLPRDPSAAIGELIERLEEETLRRYRAIAGVRAELAGLAELQRGGPCAHAVGLEMVAGSRDVRERLEGLSFFTRNSVWAIQPAGPHSKASRIAATRLDQRTLRRGADMRIIYDAAVLATERNRANLRRRVASGACIRVRRGPLQRLIIMDEQVAVISADSPDGQRGALIIRQGALLDGLLELFRLSWENAQDVEPDEVPEQTVTDDERLVLNLLSGCATDEIAAREADISVRQFRRRVARLMDRLQASSRFQAGAEAARRGWVLRA